MQKYCGKNLSIWGISREFESDFGLSQAAVLKIWEYYSIEKYIVENGVSCIGYMVNSINQP